MASAQNDSVARPDRILMRVGTIYGAAFTGLIAALIPAVLLLRSELRDDGVTWLTAAGLNLLVCGGFVLLFRSVAPALSTRHPVAGLVLVLIAAFTGGGPSGLILYAIPAVVFVLVLVRLNHGR